MQKLNSTILSLIIVFVGIIVLFLCIFLLPSLAQETVRIHPEVAYLKYPILLGMYATTLPFFYAIYETVKMIQITQRDSIFSSRIVQGLNYIKYCAYIIIGLYVVGISILYYANALPPLMAAMGFSIIMITIIVATGAAFIKNVLMKNPLKLSN